MKSKLFLLFLFLIPIILFSVEKKTESYDINFNIGINFTFNSVKVKFGQDDVKNSMIYPFLALECDVDIFDYLTLGVIAGYNQNHFKEPVDFLHLPLSLRLPKKRTNSMIFGLNLKSEPLSFGDFSIKVRGEFLYFKLFKTQWKIDLPIVNGTAIVKNSFSQISIDLLLQYDGFTGLTFFFGPQFNFLKGKFVTNEEIGSIEAQEILKYKQKNVIGIVSGVNFEVGNHIEINLELNLFSKASLSIKAYYVF